MYIAPGGLFNVDAVVMPQTLGDANVGSFSDVKITSPRNRARR